jgi:hypothetical protein
MACAVTGARSQPPADIYESMEKLNIPRVS